MSGLSARPDLRAPADVAWIAERLEANGFSAWSVGGAVRDALAGGSPGDWDLTTSARPGDVRRIFRRTVPIGIEYGTVGVLARDGRMYEVTTFRRDVETFGRKARVVFADTLEEDLERRDFTINAIAWHPLTREIRDPQGGVRDLQERTLRAVGDPEERFAEDRLRVLRALRFAGRFDLRIEPATWLAVGHSAGELGHLSAERIREEMVKVLTGQRRASDTLRLYAESGVLAVLYPELDACRGSASHDPGVDAWEHALRTVDATSPARLAIRLAALLHEVGAREGSAPAEADERARAAMAGSLARAILRRLRTSNALADRVTHLVARHAPIPRPDASNAELRRWIRLVGTDYLNDLFRLLVADCRARMEVASLQRDLLVLRARVAAILRRRPPLTLPDLAISGKDLRGLGIPPGPRFGEILEALLERVLDEPELNRPERLLEMVRSLEATDSDGGRP